MNIHDPFVQWIIAGIIIPILSVVVGVILWLFSRKPALDEPKLDNEIKLDNELKIDNEPKLSRKRNEDYTSVALSQHRQPLTGVSTFVVTGNRRFHPQEGFIREEDEQEFESLEKKIQRDPTDRDALYNMGRFLHSLGRYKDALDAYEEAIRHNPKRDEYYLTEYNIYFDKGAALVYLDRYNEALPPYKKARKIAKSHQWWGLLPDVDNRIEFAEKKLGKKRIWRFIKKYLG